MSDWPSFIKSQDKEIRNENYICDADELGLILVTGDDAQVFLQNQVSSDINEVDESHFQLSSYSTPKGRMLAVFRIIRIDNGYILILPASMVTATLQRLAMFVIKAKVALADASEHFTCFAIQTDHREVIESDLLPSSNYSVTQSDSLIALNLGQLENQQRYLLLTLSAEEAINLWQNFSEHLQPSTFDAWRLSEIKAGIPVIHPQTNEEFVAQMTNLNLLGGVNFKKGCYPGQEIVARMQYLGKLKRRMFLSLLDTDVCPSPGDDLVSNGAEVADGSGKVVDAIVDKAGRCYCLFVAQIKKAENNDLRLLKQPQTSITLLELPYPISIE